MAPPPGGHVFWDIIMNFRNLQEDHLQTISAKYQLNLVSGFRGEDCWNCWRTTDILVITKAHPEYSSGELMISHTIGIWTGTTLRKTAKWKQCTVHNTSRLASVPCPTWLFSHVKKISLQAMWPGIHTLCATSSAHEGILRVTCKSPCRIQYSSILTCIENFRILT